MSALRPCQAGRWLVLNTPDWSVECPEVGTEPISMTTTEVSSVTMFLCVRHAMFVDQLPFRGCQQS